MCERKTPIVVLFEEFQVVLINSITLPSAVYHSIEHYQVRILYLTS